MVWGELLKAGAVVGAAALSSEKLTSAVAGAIDKSVEAVDRMAKTGGESSEDKGNRISLNASTRKVTSKCIGCHAPMSGNTGVQYRCPYCDTIQTLD